MHGGPFGRRYVTTASPLQWLYFPPICVRTVAQLSIMDAIRDEVMALKVNTIPYGPLKHKVRTRLPLGIRIPSRFLLATYHT